MVTGDNEAKDTEGMFSRDKYLFFLLLRPVHY